VLQTLPGDIDKVGITMLLGFTMSFGFILPINAPQNMVCLGTDTFNGRQFARIGIPVTLVALTASILMGWALLK
jgi:di/tricarboxylate transporter